MNKIERLRRSSHSILLTTILTILTLMVMVGLSDHAHAQSQWTTTGNDISSTNTGNVGIGTTTPASKLNVVTSGGYNTYTELLGNTHTVGGSFFDQVLSSTSFTGAFRGMVVRTKVDLASNLASSALGLFSEIGVPSTNSTNLSSLVLRGSNNLAYHGGTGSLGSLQGIFGTVIRQGSGAVGTVTAIQTTIQNNNAANAITDVFGVRVGNISNIGTITNTYGVYVGDLSTGTHTNIPFSFYASDPLAYNYFAGNVGIGTTAPTTKLDVTGQIRSSTGGFKFPDGTVQMTAATGTLTGVTAGAGLTGGGTSGAATLDIGAGNGLSVAADSISVNYGSTAGTAVQGNTSVTVAAGAGMSDGGSLTLGAGGTLTLTNADRGSSQNIFKSVANATGTTQFSAGSNNDTIRFEGTGGTSVSFDAATKKISINSSISGSPISAANISAGQFGQNTGGGDFSFPANVTVAGNIAAKYQDIAEWVPAAHALPARTVVVLNPAQSNQVMASAQAYDTGVAGVVSERPGLVLGEGGPDKVLVATTGRVRIKVDATRTPIRVGDLLVTSDKQGLAMRSEPLNLGGAQIHRPGTLIGKALEPLEKGTGEILVLLSLQ